MNLWENKFLFFSVVLGVVLTIPTPYIPHVTDNVFIQGPIDVEWVLIVVIVVVFVGCSEFYKFMKRRLLPPTHSPTITTTTNLTVLVGKK